MSQVDEYAINGASPLSMATLEARLDALFGAAASYNRGATAPTNPFEGMLWWDSSAAPDVLKRYTTAAGWISILTINITTGVIAFAGLAIGTNVQAHDSDLDWLASNLTAAGKALLDDADAAAQLATLGAAAASHTHASAAISDFTEAAQDVVGAMIAAAGGSYNDGAGTIALPGGGGLWKTKASGPFSAVTSFNLTGITKPVRITLVFTAASGSTSPVLKGSINGGSSYIADNNYNHISNRYDSSSMTFYHQTAQSTFLPPWQVHDYGVSSVTYTLWNPTSTSKVKLVEIQQVGFIGGGSTATAWGVAYGDINTTSAIDAVQIASHNGPTMTGTYIIEEWSI